MEFNTVRVPAPSDQDIAHILAAASAGILEFGGVEAGDPSTLLHYADAWVAVNGIVWIKVHDESMMMYTCWVSIVADDQHSHHVDNVISFETLEEVVEYVQEFI